VKVKNVYPADDVLVGEQAGCDTLIENVAVDVPFELVAVSVIERDVKVAVGDPEISPVDVLKLIPAAVNAVESAEGIENEVTEPPEFEIV
jgi:hypothetical protein